MVKSLEKGSGGTVYLVKDTTYASNPEDTELKVLKVYAGISEFNFYQREYLSLNKISQKSSFPGIVKMLDAQVIVPPDAPFC